MNARAAVESAKRAIVLHAHRCEEALRCAETAERWDASAELIKRYRFDAAWHSMEAFERARRLVTAGAGSATETET